MELYSDRFSTIWLMDWSEYIFHHTEVLDFEVLLAAVQRFKIMELPPRYAQQIRLPLVPTPLIL